MSTHKGGTDTVHKIKLDSKLQRAAWLHAKAGAGEEVKLEVATLLVGDGAPIKIDIKTVGGKGAGKLEGIVGNGRFEGSFKIPDDCKENLKFSADLSKHGLKGESNELIVVPKRSITKAEWDREEARRNDVCKLTAETTDVVDGTEARVEIFEHDEDGGHDPITAFDAHVEGNKIEILWDYEYHEDVDEIPSEEEAEKGYKHPEYFFRVSIAPSLTKDSPLLRFKDSLEATLRDANGDPIPNAEYSMTLADGSKKDGTLDEFGEVRAEDLPPGKFKIELKPPPPAGG